MSTLNLINQKWVLTSLKPVFITCLAVIFVFAADAQLPGQLPVNLNTFKARAESHNKVKVFWTTSYEKDNGHFDIERSADGVHFIMVGRVPGVNHSGVLTDYIFYDNNALKSNSYYRLKQVDIDQAFSYSPIVRVKNPESDVSFDIYPNPAPGGEFKIDLFKDMVGKVDVLVFDLSGRLQLQQQYSNSNSNTISIKHQLLPGIYSVKVNSKEFTATRQLVIR
jgi:hypothetical protein